MKLRLNDTFIDQLIINMSRQLNQKQSYQKMYLNRRQKRFKRSQSKDNISGSRRCASEYSFQDSTDRGSLFALKFNKLQNEVGHKVTPNHDPQMSQYNSRKKFKTATQKFTKQNVQKNNCLDVQDLMIQVTELRLQNKKLELQLKFYKQKFDSFDDKENKPTNKLRAKTQKQRINQLQTQNQSLRKLNQSLKIRIKQLQDLRYRDQQNKIQYQNRLKNSQKTIFNLNERISKLQIQMDFINRRSYSQIGMIKSNNQMQLKNQRQRNEDLNKIIIQLKQKNNELVYKIKGNRLKRCNCYAEANKIKSQSLLSLSDDD